MNYFQIIEKCIVRESESGLKIESPHEENGYVLKYIEEDSVKVASFELEYKLSSGGNANFVFGSSYLRDRLIEIPLCSPGGSIKIKINLKEKIITGHINNKTIYQKIEDNIRTIKYFGFNLSNSYARFSIPDLKFKKTTPRKIAKTKIAKTKVAKTNMKAPLVCLLTRNSEQNIKNELQKIEKDFEKSNWGLVIADMNSKDSTYDIIKSHGSSAKLYHYFQFGSGISQAHAKDRVKEFVRSFENVFPHVINKELISKRSKNKIQSFCTVVTDNFKIEASILIKSLRKFHKQPIYIICDTAAKKFLEIEGFDNLRFMDPHLSKQKLKKTKEKFFSKKFTNINKYHKPECILYKMDAMNFALDSHENTFFLDADVIVLDSLQEGFHKDVVLSPHFYEEEKLENSFKYGFFNAGYIFCADKSFPDHWRDLYLNRSTFFEQEGMNHIIEKYDIQTFSKSHNFGFWRGHDCNFKVKSFHVHTIEQEFKGERTLREANQKTKEILFKYLDQAGDKELKKYIQSSEGKIWGGMDTNYNIKSSQPNGKINLRDQQVFWHHRSGWNYAIQALAPLHNNKGVLFDGFLEKNFAWFYDNNFLNNKIPYEEPWVGFFHNPPDIPKWFFYENSIQKIIEKPMFEKSLKNCVGLFALSEYHAKFLREVTGKPVSVLIHPSEIPENIFSHEKYLANKDKKIVNIGYWLRKMNSIYSLPIEKADNITKARLMPYNDKAPKEKIDKLIEKEKKIYNINIDPRYENNTTSLARLSDEEYDTLLTENVIFLDLYDSSANNAIIECIARGTPILVNPIPAVKEYLGEDYPFYFNDLNEAAEKARNPDMIKETHHYLLDCEARKKFSQETFKKDFEESEVYKLL